MKIEISLKVSWYFGYMTEDHEEVFEPPQSVPIQAFFPLGTWHEVELISENEQLMTIRKITNYNGVNNSGWVLLEVLKEVFDVREIKEV